MVEVHAKHATNFQRWCCGQRTGELILRAGQTLDERIDAVKLAAKQVQQLGIEFTCALLCRRIVSTSLFEHLADATELVEKVVEKVPRLLEGSQVVVAMGLAKELEEVSQHRIEESPTAMLRPDKHNNEVAKAVAWSGSEGLQLLPKVGKIRLKLGKSTGLQVEPAEWAMWVVR